jgi:acetyl-CoA synthetase
MIPELPVAMLACARIGAIHCVVFGGFSAEALRDRVINAEATVMITAANGTTRWPPTPLRPRPMRPWPRAPPQNQHRRQAHRHRDPWVEGRDLWYEEELAAGDINTDSPVKKWMPKNPLFILHFRVNR